MRLRAAAALASLIATGTLALATPAAANSITLKEAAQQLTPGEVLAVCNSGADDTPIGMNCVPIVVSSVPVDQVITGNAVLSACQQNEADGGIHLDVACRPLDI